MTDPQCMLIVDDEKSALAELPLHILRIGVDVFYATSGEEACLLHRAEFACFHGTHGCIIRVRGPVAPTACLRRKGLVPERSTHDHHEPQVQGLLHLEPE